MSSWLLEKTITDALTTIQAALKQLEADVTSIKGTVNKMAVDLTALNTAVTNETGAVASAITLIQGMVAEINTLIANSGNTVDPAALQALANQFNTQSTALANAVAANPLPPVTPATAAAKTPAA